MKQYRALGIISRILKVIGWITIVIAFLFVVVMGLGAGAGPAIGGGAGALLFTLLIFFALVIVGIAILASGELIEAVVDIAINSANLPSIALNTGRTVEFFERMSGGRPAS